MNMNQKAKIEAVQIESAILWGSNDRVIKTIVEGASVKKTYQLRGCTYDADNCVITVFTKPIVAKTREGVEITGAFKVLYPPTGASSLFETWNDAYAFGKRRGKRVNLINRQFSNK